MDSRFHDDVRGRVMGLLIRFGDRVDAKAQAWVHEFLDHNELGLAVETMADALSEANAPVTQRERVEMLDLVTDMHMDDRVARALSLCPLSA